MEYCGQRKSGARTEFVEAKQKHRLVDFES